MKCKECGNKVNSNDNICSKCGSEIEKKNGSKISKIILLFVAMVVIVAVISTIIIVVNKNNDEDNNSQEQEHVTKREQYIMEAITILEEYRDDEISGEEAVTKLSEIASYAKEKRDKEEQKRGRTTPESLKWTGLYLEIELIESEIDAVNLIKIEQYDKLDNNRINKYIDTLQKELEE